MSKSKKGFIPIFLLVILIILVYILFLHVKINMLLATQNAEPNPAISPYTLNPALDIDGLSMLTYWQKGIVKSANVTTELEGKIIKIDTDGVVEEHGWLPFKYALKLRIQGQNGDSNDIFITPVELQKTVFKRGNSGNMSYKELKLNDNIRAFIMFDLTKKFMDNFVSAEIIRL